MRVGTTGCNRRQSAGGKEKKNCLRKATREVAWCAHAEREDLAYLERGHHLALFLTVYQVVVVLHRNEGRQAVVDSVICYGRGWKEQFESASSVSFTACGGYEIVRTLHLMDWSSRKSD